jgi:lysophospholipase L1-like esterase
MRRQVMVRSLVRGAIALGLVGLLALAAPAQQEKEPATVRPMPRDGNWLKRHEGFVAIAKKGGIEVLFVGDSITDKWGGAGHSPKSTGAKVFAAEFEPLKAANFGISGDRTEHVLWRLQNGELDGIQPKVLMLLIGTNNHGSNSAEEIAAGIQANVKEIRQRSPKTKVLLLGIFPRATLKTPAENQAVMDKIRRVNKGIAQLDDGGKTVKYLDIGDKFLHPDGSIPREVMPDQLHLGEKGYQIWADAVRGPIKDLLGVK